MNITIYNLWKQNRQHKYWCMKHQEKFHSSGIVWFWNRREKRVLSICICNIQFILTWFIKTTKKEMEYLLSA